MATLEKVMNIKNESIEDAMTIKLNYIPNEIPKFIDGIRRAPKREAKLSESDVKLALKNALR